jgi:hypothetical protein
MRLFLRWIIVPPHARTRHDKTQGELTDFDGALKLSFTNMWDDMRMMRRKREEYLRRKGLKELPPDR